MVGKIKALDELVVNKIAAGEIIISPVNALKELMENSIDAGCSSIDVIAKEGGIKMLQITDNGCGIEKEDLPILCQRFTTSKLNKFEDLQSIETYGFRGEALASISHIARVTVTTKTKDETCAWKVSFAEGKMIGEPQPTAGRDGTVILVEDMFYNIPSRLRSLRSPNDEYSKIVDVMGRYAVHSQNIGFSCKKFGDSNFTLTIRDRASFQDRVRIVFGKNVSSNLTEFSMESNSKLDIKEVKGSISDLNFIMKKSITPTFFINNRLVSCDPLRRSLYQTYLNYLPKGSKPFIYMTLLINPASVDVNVHPTKREVRFLNQDEIIEAITIVVNETLSKLNTSKTFKTSTLLTRQPVDGPTSLITSTSQYSQSNLSNSIKAASNTANKKVYEHKLVRTDASQSKITPFLKQQEVDTLSNNYSNSTIPSKRGLPANSTQDLTKVSSKDSIEEDERLGKISKKLLIEKNDSVSIDNTSFDGSTKQNDTNDNCNSELHREPKEHNKHRNESSPETVNENEDNYMIGKDSKELNIDDNHYKIIPRKRTVVDLTSIKLLKEEVDNESHKELTNIFANLTYVGLVDAQKRLATIQYDLKLFLVDYGAICYELFYQIGLTDFANFGQINLHANSEEELTLYNILKSFDVLKDNESSINLIIQQFWSMKDMLSEYFSINLELVGDDDTNLKNIKLTSIPLLLKDYNPPLSKLPFFIYRLGTKVDWNNEDDCFKGILKQIALLYIPKMIHPPTLDKNATLSLDQSTEKDNVDYITEKEQMTELLEIIIFPCVKRRLLAPNVLLKDVVEIANLPGLYKVFERC